MTESVSRVRLAKSALYVDSQTPGSRMSQQSSPLSRKNIVKSVHVYAIVFNRFTMSCEGNCDTVCERPRKKLPVTYLCLLRMPAMNSVPRGTVYQENTVMSHLFHSSASEEDITLQRSGDLVSNEINTTRFFYKVPFCSTHDPLPTCLSRGLT